MKIVTGLLKRWLFKYKQSEAKLLPMVAAGLTAVMLIYAMTAIKHTRIIDNLELSLLDIRMAIRSLRFAPSTDVVVLASDAYTERTAQRFPQLDMTSRVLPRDKLASVVNYLNRQGAKAIVLDVELRQKKEGDDALAQAINRSGNVYAAVHFDNTLNRFIHEQNQGRSQNWPYHLALQPLIVNQMQGSISQLVPVSHSPRLHGFVSLQGQAISGFFPSTLKKLLADYSYRGKLLSSFTPLSVVRQTAKPPVAKRDMEKALYQPHCVQTQYHKFYRQHSNYLKTLRTHILKGKILHPWSNSADRKYTYCYASPLSETLAPVVEGLGASSVSYQQGFVRSVPVLYRGYLGGYYTYLGIRPVLDLLNSPQNKDNRAFKQALFSYHPHYMELDKKHYPLIDQNQLYINWRNPSLLLDKMGKLHNKDLSVASRKAGAALNNPLLGGGHMYRVISAGSVLRKINNLPPEDNEKGGWPLYNIHGMPDSGHFSFKDKIVVYGDTLKDIHRTPVGDTTFGPEIVATALDSALNDHQFIQQGSRQLVLIITGIICLLIFVATAKFFESYSLSFVFSMAVISIFWFCNLIVFNGEFAGLEFERAYWFPIVEPTAYMVLAVAFGMLFRNYLNTVETKQLTRVFSNYVSPQIMDEIVRNPHKALENLEGEKKELSVLFSDLKGFTAQFETVDPEVMVYQLNQYLDVMTNIILERGGTYDKYMGDAIMAFFGAPVDLENHAAQACEAAFYMQRALKDLNEQWKLQGLAPLDQGIGISSGEMFVGNLGSKNIKNFTVMGSHVNLGARLESLTRSAGVPIIVSERTVQIAQEQILTKPLGKAKVKGFSEPVPVYSLVSIRNM